MLFRDIDDLIDRYAAELEDGEWSGEGHNIVAVDEEAMIRGHTRGALADLAAPNLRVHAP